MSLRALFIFQVLTNKSNSDLKYLFAKPIFSRRFPTVEKRCEIICSCSSLQTYVKVPLDVEFLGQKVLDEILNDSSKFLLKSSVEFNRLTAPLYEVSLGVDGVLWPVIVVQQSDVIACAVTLVEQNISSANDCYLLPSTATGFELLTSLADHMAPFMHSEQLTSEKVGEISSFIRHCCPFGTPSSTDIELFLQSDSFCLSPSDKGSSQEMAAWRPFNTVEKNFAQFELVEKYNCELHGEIQHCPAQEYTSGYLKAHFEVSGILPEFEMEFKNPAVGSDSFVVHPCVKSFEKLNPPDDVKLTVCPLVLPFNLISYHVPPTDDEMTPQPIVSCDYSVSWPRENVAKVKFVITAAKSVMHSHDLEFLEIQFPFESYEGYVRDVLNVKLTTGSYVLSKKSKRFVWSIKKLPSVSATKPCSCSFNIRFTTSKVLSTTATGKLLHPSPSSPPSLTGSTTSLLLEDSTRNVVQNEKLTDLYAIMLFKINNFSLSRSSLKRVSIRTKRGHKSLKHHFSSTLISGDIKVWNSFGSVPVLSQIPDLTNSSQFCSISIQ